MIRYKHRLLLNRNREFLGGRIDLRVVDFMTEIVEIKSLNYFGESVTNKQMQNFPMVTENEKSLLILYIRSFKYLRDFKVCHLFSISSYY